MEHSDDKLVEYCDDNGMEQLMKRAWILVMKKARSLFRTGFKEHCDDKSQGAV